MTTAAMATARGFKTTDYLQRNRTLIYILSVMTGTQFHIPILAALLAAKLHSVTDVGLVLSSRAISCAIFEIPSGVLADILGRKLTLLSATVIRLIACSYLLVSNTFVDLVFVSAATGAADALVSGTDEAIMYDSLQACGKVDEFQQSMAFARSLWPLSASVASLLGGFLAEYDLMYPVAASILPLSVAIVAVLMLTEPSRVLAHRLRVRSVLMHTTETLEHVFTTRDLLWALMFGVAIYSFSDPTHQFKSVFLLNRGVSLGEQGVWSASAMACSSVGSFLSRTVSKNYGDSATLYLCCFAYALCLTGATSTAGHKSALLLTIASVTWGAQWPITSKIVNRGVPSAQRATIISIMSLGRKLGIGAFTPIVAWDVHTYGVVHAYRICALLLATVPTALLHWFFVDQPEKRETANPVKLNASESVDWELFSNGDALSESNSNDILSVRLRNSNTDTKKR